MSATVYFNGAFVDEKDAVVTVYDGSWLHGAGLFETMRAEHGRIFRLESHMVRLCHSASHLLAPLDRSVLPSAGDFARLLESNGLREARVRMTVSAGSMRFDSDMLEPKPTVCITATRLIEYSPDFYEQGVAATISSFQVSPTDPMAAHKTTSHLPRLLALRQAQLVRCLEALWFTTSHHLAEGSISNVFIVRNGALSTPPLDTPVVPGIARQTVLDIARQLGIPSIECPLTIEDLFAADEVLLTNAIMQVLPVVRVEKHDVGDGRVGPMAKKLLAEYRQRVREECEKT